MYYQTSIRNLALTSDVSFAAFTIFFAIYTFYRVVTGNTF